jgi:hypothetical protein
MKLGNSCNWGTHEIGELMQLGNSCNWGTHVIGELMQLAKMLMLVVSDPSSPRSNNIPLIELGRSMDNIRLDIDTNDNIRLDMDQSFRAGQRHGQHKVGHGHIVHRAGQEHR